MKPVAVVVALVLGGCAVPELVVEPGREYRLAADPAFSADERDELVAATERWREASGGAMQVRIVDDGDEADGYVHRGPSPITYRRRTLEAWIDPDVHDAGNEVVRRLAMHVEGRLFGVPVVEGERAIMNPEDVAEELTEADLDACRSVGLCPWEKVASGGSR